LPREINAEARPMTRADETDECGPNSFRPQLSSLPELGTKLRTDRTKPFRVVRSVRSSPGPGSSRFRDDAEAEFYQERAAVREYLGGVPRAAAERLAWLDVLAARQLAAGVLDHMAEPLHINPDIS
jgi:hypothetical protein